MSHCDTKTEKQHRFGRETLNFSCDERDAFKLNSSFAYYSIWFVTCHVGVTVGGGVTVDQVNVHIP